MNDNTISKNRSMMKTTAEQLREKAAYELSCKRSALHEILIKGAEALDHATKLVTYFETEYQDSISRTEAIENVEIMKEKVDRLTRHLGEATGRIETDGKLIAELEAANAYLTQATPREKAAVLAEREAIKQGLEFRFNEHLCEMKPDYDDSITGFNEAWEVMSTYFRARPAP